MSISLKIDDGRFEHFNSFPQMLEYSKEFAAWEFSIKIKEMMKIKKMKSKDIANIIGKSPAYVCRALNKGHNLTINSMMELALALNCSIEFRLNNDCVATDITENKIQKHVNWRLPDQPDPILEVVSSTLQAGNDTAVNSWQYAGLERTCHGD